MRDETIFQVIGGSAAQTEAKLAHDLALMNNMLIAIRARQEAMEEVLTGGRWALVHAAVLQLLFPGRLIAKIDETQELHLKAIQDEMKRRQEMRDAQIRIVRP